MSNKNIKAIRGQVRQIVQEVITEELLLALEQRLAAKLNSSMADVAKTVRERLDQVDKRSIEIQQYVVRNVGVPQAPKADDAGLG